MTPEQAIVFGTKLREARDAFPLTLRALSELTGIDNGLLSRIESGAIQNPNPEKLTRIAEAMNLQLADVYAWAHYTVPSQLPNPGPYLRTKFREVPEDVMAALTAEVAAVLAKHGVLPSDGPMPGEDEEPRQKGKRTTSKSSNKKGESS